MARLHRGLRGVHPLTWLLLAAGWTILAFFTFKVMSVPVDREYTANFGDARWIGVAQNAGSAGYFRKSFDLDAIPRDAFLLMQGSQSYSLYVNGTFIDKSRELFLGGHPDMTNVYDLAALLQTGQNTVAVCALNYDQGPPTMRALLGMTYAGQRVTFASDTTWRATSDPQLVKQSCGLFGRTARSSGAPVWTAPNFSDDSWPASAYTTGVRSTRLNLDPAVYETPLPTSWAMAGTGEDTFFHSSVNLTTSGEVWLRLASTGQADTYINGHLVLETPARLAADRTNPTPRAASTTTGVFDVTPYLHPGANDLAVHVTTLSSRSAANDPKSRPSALCADLLAGPGRGLVSQIVPSWQVSNEFTSGWTTGSGTSGWPQAVTAASGLFSSHPPYRVIGTTLEKLDFSLTAVPLLLATAVFGIGVVLATLADLRLRGGRGSLAAAIDRVGLAFSASVALGVLLFGLKLEPLVPRPFPYTPAWLTALAVLPIVTFIAIQLPAWRLPHVALPSPIAAWTSRIPKGVGVAGALVGLVGLAAFMASYGLSYESYWQDELSSVFAAVGILQDGIPHLASGFIYAKGEMFSYMLAGFIWIFGQDSTGPRLISVLEYLISLPLTFFVGRYLFGKRVGLLATALVVFSPLALLWARQARMYQQAELAVLILMYVFYRACEPGAKTRYIYGSMAAVVAMYLSHEESFIVLPAVAVFFLATQRFHWVKNAHWWIAGLGATAVILAQLLFSVLTHPPALGNDTTQRPMVSWSPENFDFYMPLLVDGGRVMAHAFQLGWTSALALLMCLAAFFVRDRALRFTAVFFAVPLLVLIFFFSLNADRYLYPLFPPLVFLAALAVVRACEAVNWTALRLNVTPLARGLIVTGFAATAVIAVLQSQVTPVTYFGLASSRLLGLDYHHRYPDYQTAGVYIRDHWQAGDTLITVAPSIDGIYYAEQPNYIIYQGKALYLYQQNGHIYETLSGAMAILSGRDLSAVMGQQHRIWLMSTSYYRATLPKGFRPVFEGQQTLVYLRDGVNPDANATMQYVATTPGA